MLQREKKKRNLPVNSGHDILGRHDYYRNFPQSRGFLLGTVIFTEQN